MASEIGLEARGRHDTDSMRQGAALAAPIEADRLDLSGADAARFLHNLTTADVTALAPGGSVRGFVTSPQGRTLADFDLLASEDRFVLRLPAGRAAAIAEHFSKYRVMERADIGSPAPARIAELRGARGEELLGRLGIEAPVEAGSHAEHEIAGATVRVRRALRGREPRFELWFDADEAEALDRLRAEGAGLGLIELDVEAREALRIEDGELAWGVDYGEDAFPQETGEEGAISWTKGCYLGQEVVARIRYRGATQRTARGLRFPEGPPEPGMALLAEGREAGRVTSVARSARFGAIGLAIVHRRAGEPPSRLELEGGGAAELANLPFD